VGELVAIEFRSKSLRVDRSLEGRVQECLKEFANSGSFKSAQNLRHLAFPTSEYYASRCLPDGRWVVEIDMTICFMQAKVRPRLRRWLTR
jgi:hypothetical protein